MSRLPPRDHQQQVRDLSLSLPAPPLPAASPKGSKVAAVTKSVEALRCQKKEYIKPLAYQTKHSGY